MQSIYFYHKINNNINKNTSALQLVEARSTIEPNKDLIHEKTYNEVNKKKIENEQVKLSSTQK